MNDGSGDVLSNEDKVFIAEQQLIREYAMRGPAIFIGRCAAEALKDENVLTVFIRADEAFRTQRIIREYGIPEKAVSSTMTKFDKKRKRYYAAYTGRNWTDWSHYQIILDSGKLGIETCAELIKAALA